MFEFVDLFLLNFWSIEFKIDQTTYIDSKKILYDS